MDSKLSNALSEMILSASGWRGIFAETGGEESPEKAISEAHGIIAAAAAKVYSDYLSSVGSQKGAVIVGRDTRPTGDAIADAVIRSLLAEGREVLYSGVTAAPEIMAFARSLGEAPASPGSGPVLGFIYISASHNPIGHNGIKFGLTDGGVLQASETAKLVSAFHALSAQDDQVEKLKLLFKNEELGALAAKVYASESDQKKAALKAYRDFTTQVISGFNEEEKADTFFESILKGLKKRPIGIAVDFNGSARTVSIDNEFLNSIGAAFFSINNTPGEIAHRIVPEGESLDPCRNFLEELHRKDPTVILGYLPDCDGDRGNLVIWDDGEKQARSLEAQEVFALACVAELSTLVWTGQLSYDSQGKALNKAAIAVNDPTSLRIDWIARAFDVEVHRAEVGEANVVGLARKLREQGYLVRILGEGSSGGTIIHPSAVRDPIDTIGAILKLLAIPGGNGEGFAGMTLFQIWCQLSKQIEKYRDGYSLADIIASLPAFVSTGAYTNDALLKVKTLDHSLLKEKYQKVFLREWEEKKDALLEQFNICGWEATVYIGMEEKRGITQFSEAGKGGLKIEFKRTDGKAACIWMRGSGTEPVFRVMADAQAADDKLERYLIEWQRKMVQEADNA